MALINKPDYSEIWASGGSIVEPSDVKKQTGWTAEVPPYQWENWIQNRQDQMLAHINQRGIPEWDSQTEYEGSGLSYVQGSNGVVYKSVTSSGPSTVAQNPTTDLSQVYWVTAFVENGAVTLVNTSQTLTSENVGFVVINASSNITVTLPATSDAESREFLLQRQDITSSRVVIATTGAETIMLDTVVNTSGQSTTELLFSGDYLRLRSDGAGRWWCVGQAQLPGSIASGLVVFSSPGVHSFDVPPVLRSGRLLPKITLTGGGGGGSRIDGSAGAGGGAGGSAIGVINLSGVESVSVTVGAAGGPGTSGNPSGGQGGTSSFGSYLSATGGQGGTGSSSSGGEGGTGAGGSINLRGEPGGAGVPGVAPRFSAGNGGSSIFGGGGRGTSANTNVVGDPGVMGSGGSGGTLSGTGGTGGPGIIVVEW